MDGWAGKRDLVFVMKHEKGSNDDESESQKAGLLGVHDQNLYFTPFLHFSFRSLTYGSCLGFDLTSLDFVFFLSCVRTYIPLMCIFFSIFAFSIQYPGSGLTVPCFLSQAMWERKWVFLCRCFTNCVLYLL